MALLNLKAFRILDVRADPPVFAEADARECPLCGALHPPTEFRVVTIRLVGGRDRAFDVLLCLDCITRHTAAPASPSALAAETAASR